MWTNSFWPEYWSDNYWSPAGADPPPITGQTPRASRYRLGHRVDWVHAVGLIVAFIGVR